MLVCVSRPSPCASASGRAPLSPGHCHLLVTGEKGGVDCFLPELKDHLMHLGASRVLAGAGLPPSCKECGRLLRDSAKGPADVVWAGDSHRASERAEACCPLFWPECRDLFWNISGEVAPWALVRLAGTGEKCLGIICSDI